MWNQTLDEPTVREIFRLHMHRKNTTEISLAVGAAPHVVADVTRGKSWAHLHGKNGCPTLSDLKAGGVRRGKLSEEDKETILFLIQEGLTNKAIAAMVGVSTTPISNLRTRGRTW
jgi:hypothetical protein